MLFQVYLPLLLWGFTGFLLVKVLPLRWPEYLASFLFWVGIPLAILAFIRRAELSSSLWVAALVAWGALLSGFVLAFLWYRKVMPLSEKATQTLILSAGIGNTGFVGFPILLALVDVKYFGWALVYDLFGTALGGYGLGPVLSEYWQGRSINGANLARSLVSNPVLLSFALALLTVRVPLSTTVEAALQTAGSAAIDGSLLLLGMRLGQVKRWGSLLDVVPALLIKMLLVPLAVWAALRLLGFSGPILSALVLQSAMPPAFATLVLAETYDQDRLLAVTAIAAGMGFLALALPLWSYVLKLA
jgi:malate permease and related proteins